MDDRNFENMLDEGQIYEGVIAEYLESKGNMVISTLDNPSFQNKGVDLIITRDLGDKFATYYGEVKADSQMHRTGNIFTEDGMTRETGFYKGWLYKCRADIIFYVDTINNIVYSID